MQITEKFKTTIERETSIDPNESGFYAWVMHDNHTFTKTKLGTTNATAERVLAIKGTRGMALYSLHHESLDKETKLVTTRDIGKITAPDTWMKPHNPFVD